MRADIMSGQSDLAATESLCSMNNPPVIQEYLAASAEDKQLFEMTFKAFKTNTQLKAKGRWYDWHMGLMEKIIPDVKEMYDGMKAVSSALICLHSATLIGQGWKG